MTYKLANYPRLAEFLDTERVATLAVPVDIEGTIHLATLQFWHTTEPLAFYFVTELNSEKCTLLKSQTLIKAACVVGTVVKTPFTVQMRGAVSRITDIDLTDYYKKHGNHLDDIAERKNVCLVFRPNWVRFTDYSKGWDHAFIDAT